MSLIIDANMKLFAERMNITSSRMIRDYGLSTIDEIIEAEAAQGNTKAVNFAREYYHSPEKLIKLFKLTDIENKFVLLHNMEIGRASVGKECVRRCRSRWSPYH